MSFPMDTQLELDDYDGTINANEFADQEDRSDYEGTINANEYAASKEAEELTWWDSAKEAGLQAAAGLGQAFTYPLDILKMAVIGEGLTDIDELESAFEKAGKPFDRNKYIQAVMEQGEFVPTQSLLERKIDETFGTNIEHPKTKTGKFFNKLFFLGGLTKGKGLTKAGVKQGFKSGVKGATTTAVLREAGVPEPIAELAGDYKAVAALEKQPRKLSPEAMKAVELAEKRGLPLSEFMLRENVPPSAKISSRRREALEKKLGTSSEEAINQIIQEKIPASKLRAQGHDLQVLEDEAYELATNLAKKNPEKLSTKELVADIDKEINRINSLAPSLGEGKSAAIKVLEAEKTALSKATPNTEQLIQQTREYNSNVKSIYKKPEYSGKEEEIKNAYAFLNDRIRNTIEKQAGKEIIDAHKAANTLFAENSALARSEGLITKAFQNGQYNPKKLNQLLSNKGTGAQLRKDLGPEGVKELKQIAEYGEKAQKVVKQFSNSSKNKFKISEWGPLAAFIFHQLPPLTSAAVAAKPIWDYARGYFLTKPATRKAYSNIVKNAANGSFKNMAKDFAIIENQVIEDFGSIDDFMKQGISELRFYREGEEDED